MGDYITHKKNSIKVNTKPLKESPYYEWYLEKISEHIGNNNKELFGVLSDSIYSRYGL